MRNCAIVCEYNPFHSGHKFQLDCVHECGANNITCVMSGNFVQSARPAFCDKSLRAECALLGGADAVIELPTIYATASAGYFAEGALKIISHIKDVDHIAMGATADGDILLKISELKIKRYNEFAAFRSEYLNSGKSYNFACSAALSKIFAKYYPDAEDISYVFDDPNNILCIEYITAIDKLAPNVEPLILPRIGARHNEHTYDAEYISATAIRNAIANGNSKKITKYLPFNSDKITTPTYDLAESDLILNAMAVYAVKSRTPEEIRKLRHCSDGMEFLLEKLSKFSTYDDYINSEACKRYGKKRMDRLFLDCILDIKKEYLDRKKCTRLLGCKKDFDFTILPDFVKTNNADIKKAASVDSGVSEVLGVDMRATALYNTLCSIDGDYFNYSLVKL